MHHAARVSQIWALTIPDLLAQARCIVGDASSSTPPLKRMKIEDPEKDYHQCQVKIIGVWKNSKCPNFSALRNASQSAKGRAVESSNACSRDALHAATLQVPTMRISGLSVKATSLYSSFPRNFYLFRASLCPLLNKNLSYNVLEKTKISDSFPTTPHCHEGSPTHFCVIGLVSRGEREH